MTGPGEVVTGFVLRLTRLGGFSPEPAETNPSFLTYEKTVELSLVAAWAIVGGVLLVVPLLSAWIGQQRDGVQGRAIGMDIGFGPFAFAFAGALLHYIRMIVLAVYQRAVFRGRDPLLMALNTEPAPPVRPWLRHILKPTTWDVIIQTALAIATVLVALHLTT